MHDPDRDPRAYVVADTGRPRHGRMALRLTVPTTAPLIMPVSNAGATPGGCSDGDQGFQLSKPGAKYSISLWARSSTPGMVLSVLVGSWTEQTSNYTGRALQNTTLTSDWAQVNATASVRRTTTAGIWDAFFQARVPAMIVRAGRRPFGQLPAGAGERRGGDALLGRLLGRPRSQQHSARCSCLRPWRCLTMLGWFVCAMYTWFSATPYLPQGTSR